MAVYTVTNEYKDLENGTTILFINSPTHGLKEVYIDTEDKEKVSKFHWNVSKRKRPKGTFNVVTPKNDELESTLLYRYIMNAPKEMNVDHRDGNPFNNRKSNLRICTQADNNKNLKIRKNNTSGHKGVCWVTKHSKWMAYIKINTKFKNLGLYNDINEAIKAREKAEGGNK